MKGSLRHVSGKPSRRDWRSVMHEFTEMGSQALKHNPILALAADRGGAAPHRFEPVVEVFRSTLYAMITRDGGRDVGACHICRHFREGGGSGQSTPYHCELLDELLSEADSRLICVEQQAIAS
jgi:hypothetical protein